MSTLHAPAPAAQPLLTYSLPVTRLEAHLRDHEWTGRNEHEQPYADIDVRGYVDGAPFTCSTHWRQEPFGGDWAMTAGSASDARDDVTFCLAPFVAMTETQIEAVLTAVRDAAERLL